jgi:hypothetical protein
MANFNRSDLKTQTGNLIPDNTNESITPALDRQDRENHADSLVSRLDDPYFKILGTTGGSSTVLTLSSLKDYPSDAYNANIGFIFKMNTNSGASPTISINGLTALPIYTDLQSQITDADDLVDGRYYAAIYSASADGGSTAGIVIILRFGSTEVATGVRTNSVSYTIGDPGTYVFDGTSAASWTLPATSSSIQWSKFYIANVGTADITLDGNGTDPIANSDTFTIYSGTGLKTLVWDGETWHVSN